MSSDNRFARYVRSRDWRIWFGLVATILWISGSAWYVLAASRSSGGADLGLEAIGSFLEGAFAPVAFLWLVIGLFIQQRELAANSEALRKTSEQSEKQTLAIAATEMNARQETFFKIKESVSQQLGGISGMLYASAFGPAGNGQMSRDEMEDMFGRVAKGDCEAFARAFLSLEYLENLDMHDTFFGTDIRRRHSGAYLRTFERLRRLARNCDVDGIIEDALLQNAFGLLYQHMKAAAPDRDAP